MTLNPYIPLLMLFGFAALLGGIILALSHLLGPHKMTPEKGLSYECGVNPLGSTRERFSVKFYLVAMLFILFDVEVVFLYPWAVLYRNYVKAGLGPFVFIEMLIFLGILAVGLAYVYGKRALKWE
jgi:NADH-quinone oxidoreductase subunit A